MGNIPALPELAIIAIAGTAVTVVLSRLRLPTVAGLLVAGALLGPYGLGAVLDLHAIEILAEVGVVLLLFTIGLEFSFRQLRHIFRRVALGGALQVGATIGVTAAVALLLGQSAAPAIFFGFIFALSSTAIVLRALAQRGELDAPHGRFIVGTLIFQDLCVVLMVLLVPTLASPAAPAVVATEIGIALGKAAAVVGGALLFAGVLVPRLLRWVDASRSREVFLLAVLAICVGTAWLTSLAGLSLALGAFLGGMVVADTEFQHRAMGEMIPLRDAFVSVFFVSLGMLFDVRVALSHPAQAGLLLLAFVAGKAVIAVIAATVMRFPARAAWLAGIGLGQFGEFGFVLLRLGEPAGLVDQIGSSLLLVAGIASMFLTPLLIRAAPHITAGERILAPLARLLRVRTIDEVELPVRADPHVVVVGYGLAGRLLGGALRECGISHLVLELNAETVREARDKDEPVFYADATSPEALGHARVEQALAVVVLINDPQGATRVLDTLHRVAPHVPVLVRTRYFGEVDALGSLGAADVVAEEVEAGLEVMARLLRRLEVPLNVIEARLREARRVTQASGRSPVVPRRALPEHDALADLKIESLLVTEHSAAAGSTAQALDIRQRTRALVVAIRRGTALLDAPDPQTPFEVGDVVYVVGSRESILKASALLERGVEAVG